MKETGQAAWQMYRSLLFSVYIPSFLMSLCQSSILLMIPLFALDLGESVGIAALVFSLRGLGNMTADVPAGYGVARVGDKYVMLTGISVMGVTGFATSQADSALQLAVAAFLFGISMSTWLIARLAHIAEVVPVHQRGKAISTMAGLNRFGGLVGPLVSGFVAHQFGFTYVFVMVALVSGTALLMVIFFVRNSENSNSGTRPALLRIVPHILGRHQRTFLTAGVAVLLLTVLRAGRHLLVPIWGNAIGLDAQEIGLVVSLAGAIDMTMFPLAGFMMDNWGRKYAGASCLGLMSLGLALIPLSTSFTTLCLLAMLTGIGNGLGSGINMILGSDFAPPEERGEFLGVWRLVGDSGSFGGPILLGYVANVLYLGAAFKLLASLGLVGVLIMVFMVREPLTKRQLRP